MKKHRKQRFACVLCLFFVFSVFGSGLISSGSQWGFQAYADDDRSVAPAENMGETADLEDNAGEDADKAEAETADTDDGQSAPEDTVSDEAVSDDSSGSSQKKTMKALEGEAEASEEKAVGDFLVTGGVEGTDYVLATIEGRKVLQIMTGTSLTIKNKNINTATAQTIEIVPNIKADVTLAGVNIAGYAPFNLMTPTVCHITLADGTTNTLNATRNYATAALHCGEGSTLYIDDSVLNWTSPTDMVTPVKGMIGEDVTLIGGQQLKKGDPLSKLNSSNRGKLIAIGGNSSAAIGTGPQENAGTMIFNGGDITASCAFGQENVGQGGGAGIGTGAGKVRGTPDMGPKGGLMVFNSAKIDATGAYHGAGIGAGWSAGNTNTRQRGAAQTEVSTAATGTGNCGDITINGGFLKSTGGVHGNAFGAACGTTANGCKIRITGGTLLPVSNSSYKDIGGSGGHVIISGGSVRCMSTSKFQGIGDTAWGNENDFTSNENKVFMTKINLSAEGITNEVVYGWKLLIGGEEYDYGSPAQFDEGNLYLWLPSTAVGKEVTVQLGVQNSEGKPQPIDPLFIPSADSSGNATLKRYIDFKLPEVWTDTLSKDYDGEAFAGYNWEEDPVPTEEKIPKKLKDSSKIKIKVQRYDKIDGKPIEAEQEMEGANTMPMDAGIYKLIVTSTEYAVGEFADSYWGHRAYGWATINKVSSKTTSTYAIKRNLTEGSENYGKIQTVKVTATVRPGDGTKSTCKAPDGKVQFYINGVKVGAPVDLGGTAGTGETIDTNGNVRTVTKTFEFDKGKYPSVPELESGEFIVEAKYVEGTNYEDSEAESQLTPWKEDGDSKGDEPTIDDIVSKFPFINPPVPTISKADDEDLKDNEKVDGNKLKLDEWERIEQTDGSDPETWPLHGYYSDSVREKIKKDTVGDAQYFADLINNRYVFTNKAGYPLYDADDNLLKVKAENIVVKDENGEIVDLDKEPVDLSEKGKYVIVAELEDANGNKSTITIDYALNSAILLPNVNIDTDNDGIPDLNIDKDDDGIPETNIDTDGDMKPDINIDTDGDGKPDVDIDTDGDGKPDINKDTDGDGKADLDIDTDGDGKPDVNVDTNGDGKPDINKDTDGDGKPDVDIDTDGDGKPDINKDTDGDGKADLDIDTDGDGKPDVNVDTNGDGKPDVNIDTNGDGKPDVDIDTDGDGKPDVNVDTDGDGKPDINIDTDGDGKPDINIDTDGDGIPDLNIDTDGDGIPDLNIDADGDGKPDVNVDTDGDGKPDKNIDKDYKSKYDKDDAVWHYPKTGDESSLVLWLSLMGAAVLALGAGVLLRMRRNAPNK